MQLGVGGLQVVELDGFAQQLFVKGQREAPVDVVTVKNCQAHHTTHKVEIWQVVLKRKTVWDTASGLISIVRYVGLLVCTHRIDGGVWVDL